MKSAVRATLACACLLPLSAFAASPFDGTWKADMSTAKLPAKPSHYELSKGVFRCFTCVPQIDVKADGADHAVAGSPYFDTLSVTVVDSHTIHNVGKKAGRPTIELTVTVSDDGKTITREYTDNTVATGSPMTGKETLTRIAAGPKGSAAISGQWRATAETDSDNALTITYKVDGDVLSMTSPIGMSFAAKLDGTEAPYKGDPGTTSVAVRKLGPDTIEETDKRDGKVTFVLRTVVAPDGKTARVTFTDKLHATTTSLTANKVAG